MRNRVIKPSFWTDAAMAALPAEVKLFYIGTWQLSDDGGYFEWNVPEIAMQLYGYSPTSRRERWVKERAAVLVSLGRLKLFECGHAYITHFTKHQSSSGGYKVLTHSSAHLKEPASAKTQAAQNPVETMYSKNPDKPMQRAAGRLRAVPRPLDGMG